MTKNNNTWTAPYCNTTHRIVGNLQLTVVAHPDAHKVREDGLDFAEAKLFVRGMGFDTQAEQTFWSDDHRDYIAAAQAWLEDQARMRGMNV